MRNLPKVLEVRLSGEIVVIYVEACNGNFFISNYLLKQKLTTVAGTAFVAWTNILRKVDNFPQPDICVLLERQEQQHSVKLAACMWPFLLWVKEIALEPDQIPSYL